VVVAEKVHHLVVAQEGLHAAAGALGLVFESHQQIEGLSDAGAAIEDISCLYQHGRPARPAALRIDDPSGLQDADEPFERAMHVADRHDSRCLRLEIRGL
jgi:hypothetical protein